MEAKAAEKEKLMKEAQARAEMLKRWGGGLAQAEEREQMMADRERAANGAFARTIDDEEMNRDLASVSHWGDPALLFMKKKVHFYTLNFVVPEYTL